MSNLPSNQMKCVPHHSICAGTSKDQSTRTRRVIVTSSSTAGGKYLYSDIIRDDHVSHTGGLS